MQHAEILLDGLAVFVRDAFLENHGTIARGYNSPIYYVDLLLHPNSLVCANIKFRIRGRDVHAPQHGSSGRGCRTIALDGIEVLEDHRRRGIANRILRILCCSQLLRDEPCRIVAVVLNPISDEMVALLTKLGLRNFQENGVACITSEHFGSKMILD